MKKVFIWCIILCEIACKSMYHYEHRRDFGLTAKTYNGFSNPEEYNYEFDSIEVLYKDKNGENVELNEKDFDMIENNVQQCLVDAGYGYDPKKKKKIKLTLRFIEDETINQDLYYDEKISEVYRGYNFSFEPYIGPKNKNFLIYRSVAGWYDDMNEVFINHNGKSHIYYVNSPNYSKFGGIKYHEAGVIDVDECLERETLYCKYGKVSLSNFHALLIGKENNKKKFYVNLHFKTPIAKNDSELFEHRKYIIDFLSNHICLFISDNVNDIGIAMQTSKQQAPGMFYRYQDMKNKTLYEYSLGNYYIVKDKKTGSVFSYPHSEFHASGFTAMDRDDRRVGTNVIHNLDLYSNRVIDSVNVAWIGRGVRYRGSYVLDFYKNKFSVDKLLIGNKIIREK